MLVPAVTNTHWPTHHPLEPYATWYVVQPVWRKVGGGKEQRRRDQGRGGIFTRKCTTQLFRENFSVKSSAKAPLFTEKNTENKQHGKEHISLSKPWLLTENSVMILFSGSETSARRTRPAHCTTHSKNCATNWVYYSCIYLPNYLVLVCNMSLD